MDFAARINALRAKRAPLAADVQAIDDEIAQIVRQALEAGYSPTKLAEEIGVTRARVYQLKKRG